MECSAPWDACGEKVVQVGDNQQVRERGVELNPQNYCTKKLPRVLIGNLTENNSAKIRMNIRTEWNRTRNRNLANMTSAKTFLV